MVDPKHATKRHAVRPIPRTLAATLVSILGAGSPVLAQTPAGIPPAPSSGTILKRSAPPEPLPAAPRTGLRLPARGEPSSDSSIEIPIKDIVIEGNELIATKRLKKQVAEIIGRTVTLARLKHQAARITDVYHKQGYTLSYAYIPAQQIDAGRVRIAVVETRYDRINITGDSRMSNAQVRRIVRVAPGDPIAEQPLQRSLLLMHRTPATRVSGTLAPGREAGTSTLNLQLQDRPRGYGTLTGDNYGSDTTGALRSRLKLGLANPLGYGSRLTVNGMATESGLLTSVGGRLVSPDLWNGLRLTAYGSHTQYVLGEAFAALNLHGHADQFGMDASFPLILQPGRLLQITTGWERQNFRQYQRRLGLDQKSHINVAKLRLSGVYAHASGGTTSGNIGVRRGRLYQDSPQARQADNAGPDAAGTFWVGQFRLGHTQPLPARLNFRLTLDGQLASRNLDGAEKLYLGGPFGVKSAPVGDAGGDSGLLGQARLARPLPLPAKAGRLTGALQAQAGKVWINHNRFPGFTGTNQLERYGVGASLNYQWRDRLSGQVSYSHALGSPAKQSAATNDDQIWAQFRLDF